MNFLMLDINLHCDLINFKMKGKNFQSLSMSEDGKKHYFIGTGKKEYRLKILYSR